MGTIQPMNTCISSFPHSCGYNLNNRPSYIKIHTSSRSIIRATATVGDAAQPPPISQEPPSVNLAFVSKIAVGPAAGWNARCAFQNRHRWPETQGYNAGFEYGVVWTIFQSRPLLNCAGGGTCGTCMVEIIEGKELLSPRTDKEKEKLNRNPKNWRLACQTTVGKPDSTGLVVIQQLPEWKGHEWTLGKEPPPES